MSTIFAPHETQRFEPGGFLNPHDGQVTWAAIPPQSSGEWGRTATIANASAKKVGERHSENDHGMAAGGPAGSALGEFGGV